MHHSEFLKYSSDQAKVIASSLRSNGAAEVIKDLLCALNECLVITYDSSTRFVAEHLAEELNVRYRAGDPFGRPDRKQIPCVSCHKDSLGLFKTSLNLDFRLAGQNLLVSCQGHCIAVALVDNSLPTTLPDEGILFQLSTYGRVLMHGICEWFEPEFAATFNGSAQTALAAAFDDYASTILSVLQDVSAQTFFAQTQQKISQAVRSGGYIFLFGNGGSATDVVEITAFGRSNGLPTVHLLEPGYVTCAYNDSHPVFARAFQQLRPPHLAWGFSTSGNSENVNLALRQARENGLVTIGFSGKDGGKLIKEGLGDVSYQVPNGQTQRIQEVQFLLGSMILASMKGAL